MRSFWHGRGWKGQGSGGRQHEPKRSPQVYWERVEAMGRWAVDALQCRLGQSILGEAQAEAGPGMVAARRPGRGAQAIGTGSGYCG